MLTYDIEISYTTPDVEHMLLGAITVTVDHEIKTTDDVRKVTAEIGRAHGFTSCKIISMAQRPEDAPSTELAPIDPEEFFS